MSTADPKKSSSSTTTTLKSSLQNLKHLAADKVSAARAAIEKTVDAAAAMFPVIDLTEDSPNNASSWPAPPVPVYEIKDSNDDDVQVLGTDYTSQVCPSCTYKGIPTPSGTCAVCHAKISKQIIRPAAPEPNGHGHGQNGSSTLYPSLAAVNGSLDTASGNAPDPLTWSCSKCTLQNNTNETICAACGGKREEGLKTPATKRASLNRSMSAEQCWPCPSCTFLNSQSGNVCLMCSTPKKTSGKGSSEKFEANDVAELRKFHEEEAIQQWEGIVDFCRKDRNSFVDDRFPPTMTSIAVGKIPPEARKVQTWLRPSQLRGSGAFGGSNQQWTVSRTPMASDIRQGVLGDCWFLCALSVVAERPALINNVIMTRNYNREGAYLIRLCIDGLWKVILVDDVLPADAFGNLAFSQAARRQLWVPLIEKALAKAHGSYYAIEGGFVNEGMMFLTGAPCQRIKFKAATDEEIDSVWAELISCHSAGFLMGASCGKPNESMNEEECKNMGLRPRHSYSVLDVVDIDGLRLVRLRDPWGRQAWKGDWSDRSKLWTPALAARLTPQGGSEGLFWISLPDLLKYFDTVDVSKYREHWKELRVQGSFPNSANHRNWKVWNLSLAETTEVDLTLYQQGYRGASTDANAHHVDLLIVVLSVGRDRQIDKLVSVSKRSTFSFVGTSCLLDKGNYIIWTIAMNHWNDLAIPEEAFPKYVIAVHSAKPVVVERLSAPPFGLADAVILWTRKKGTVSRDQDGVTSYAVMSGGLVLVMENLHPSYGLQLICDCTKSTEVVSDRGTLYTVDFVPPLHRMVVTVLSPSRGSGFYIHYSTKYRLANPRSGLGDWGPPNTFHFPAVDTKLLRDLHGPRRIL